MGFEQMTGSGFIDKDLGACRVPVSLYQVLFYARVTGQTDRVYLDEAYARQQGYPSVMVPTGLLFGLEMQTANPYAWFASVGLDASKTLHAAQSFECHEPCFAGDTLTFAARVNDVYSKKNGALYFVSRITRVTNQHGRHVVDLQAVFVEKREITNGGAKK